MAKGNRSLIFNIKTTADFAQLDALSNAIKEVSHSVDALAGNMKSFNREMGQIKSTYTAATASVNKLATATVKYTRSLNDSSAAQNKYNKSQAKQNTLFATMKQQTTSLTAARNRLQDAEEKLNKTLNDRKSTTGDISKAKKEHAEAAKAYAVESKALDALEKDYKEAAQAHELLKKEIASGKGIIKDSMSGLAGNDDAINKLSKIRQGFIQVERQALATGNSFTTNIKKLNQLRDATKFTPNMALQGEADDAINREIAAQKELTDLVSKGNKQRIIEEKRVADVLKQSDAAQERYQKEQAARAKTMAQVEVAHSRANREQEEINSRATETAINRQIQLLKTAQLFQMVSIGEIGNKKKAAAARDEAALDAVMVKMKERYELETRMEEHAIQMNKEHDQIQKASAQKEKQAITEATNALKQQQQVMNNLQTKMRAIASAMANAFKGMAGGGAGAFSNFTRGLMQAQTRIGQFATAVQHAMKTAQRAMTSFYNSGWSLLTSGYMFKNFGEMFSRNLMSGVQDYMQYEQNLTRAAIAGQDTRGGGTGVINSEYIQELVFGLQRGDIGSAALKQFSADDIAKSSYFLSSAIGQPIIGGDDPERNLEAVGSLLSNILQLSAASMTDVETATKGIVNMAMEFGISPKDAIADPNGEAARLLKDLPSQVAYLANATTQEVPDILEMFKMVGPMAHILTDSNEIGAGLMEVMALSKFTSDLGLRGSRVGSGVNQALTTLLDPSDKSIQMAADAWGSQFGEATKENWMKFFFADDGTLEGGIQGFLGKFNDIAEGDQARVLAELFTTNATRNLVAIQQALKDNPIEDVIKDLQSDAATGFLGEAFEETNATLFASVQGMINALFQLKAAIIGSFKEPLIDALDTVAQAFYKIADIVIANPWIGKLIGGMIAFIAILSTVVGSLFMVGGSLLLMMKAFTIFGGMVGPAVLLLSSFASALMILVPLFAVVGGAILYMKHLWNDTNQVYNETTHGLMEVDNAFKTTVLTWKDALLDVFSGITENGPTRMNEALNTFNAVAIASGDAIVGWAQKNRDAFATAAESVRDFVDGFVSGFLATAASFAIVGVQVAKFTVTVGKKLLAGLESVIEKITGVSKEATNLAQVFGGVLGTAFAALVLRHFVPGLATTIALRGAFIALRLVMVGFAAVTFLISAAFKAFGLAIAVVQTLWSALSAVFTAGQAAMTATTITTTAAQTAQTTVTITQTAATSALGAVMSWVTIIVMGLVIAYFALGAAIAALLVGMVALVAIQDGWRAGLDAAREALTGVYDGFMMVVQPLMMFVAGIVILVGKLLEFIGVMVDVHSVGVALGIWMGLMLVAATALTLALAGLATIIAGAVVLAFLQWIATIIAANIPILLIVAGIVLLLGVLSEILGFDGVFEMLGSGFNYVADAAKWAWDAVKSFAGAIKDLFTTTNDEVIQLRVNLRQGEINDLLKGADEYATLKSAEYANLHGGFKSSEEAEQIYNQFYNEKYNEIYSAPNSRLQSLIEEQRIDQLLLTDKPLSNVNADQYAYGGKGAPTFKSPEEGKKGLWASVEAWMAEYGFDPKDPMGSIMKLMGTDKLDEFTDAGNVFDITKMGDTPQAQYMRDMDVYMDYGQKIGDLAVANAKAQGLEWADLSQKQEEAFFNEAKMTIDKWYVSNGMQIPVEPVLNEEAAQESVDAYMAFVGDLSKAMAQGGDLGTMMGLSYGKGSAATGIMAYGEQIISAIGDRAPWMNQTELFADAAISGDLSQGLAGKNMQKELEPFLRITAQQTGVTMQELLKEIPKFMAPDELIGVATTEMIQALDTIPESMATQLDLLGTDVQDRWGNFVAENGFNWEELATFAASQGANQDWNLVDYAVEAWDMTVTQAEEYFRSHGIDPNIINGALFGDTQMIANTMGGSLAVVNEEWFNWIDQFSEGGNKVLTMTQAQFDQIPDAVKLGLNNMEYSFIIAAGETVAAIDQANLMLAERLQGTYNVFDSTGKEVGPKAAKAFWDGVFADLGDNGIIDSAYSRVDNADGTSTITDILTGETITIPTLEIQGAEEYAAQLAELERKLGEWRTRRDALKEEIRNLMNVEDVLPTADQKTYDSYGNFVAGGGVQAATLRTDIELEIGIKQDSLDRTRTAINNALGIGGGEGTTATPFEIEISVPPEVSEALNTTLMPMVKTAVEKGFQEVVLDESTLTFDLTETGKAAAETFKTGFGTALIGWNPKPATPVNNPTGIGLNYGMGTTTTQTAAQTQTVKVVMDKTAFETSLASVNTSMTVLGNRAVFPSVYLDASSAFASMGSLFNMLNVLDGKVVTTRINVITQTSTQKLASGGIVNSDFQLVGEHGPEMVALPRGSRVSTNSSTNQMIMDSNAELHSLFAQASRNESSQSQGGQNGGTTVVIENITINNDKDGQKFFEQMDRWQGNKVQLANRGMVPTENNI
jgi:hypothetical protein